MNEVTVTMPLSKYEEMKAEIKRLENEHVSKFVEIDYPTYEHLLRLEPVINVKSEAIIDFMCPGSHEVKRLARIAKLVNEKAVQ